MPPRWCEKRGGAIVHADITLLCEAPRIGPYRDLMRARIAAMLGFRVGASEHQGDHQ